MRGSHTLGPRPRGRRGGGQHGQRFEPSGVRCDLPDERLHGERIGVERPVADGLGSGDRRVGVLERACAVAHVDEDLREGSVRLRGQRRIVGGEGLLERRQRRVAADRLVEQGSEAPERLEAERIGVRRHLLEEGTRPLGLPRHEVRGQARQELPKEPSGMHQSLCARRRQVHSGGRGQSLYVRGKRGPTRPSGRREGNRRRNSRRKYHQSRFSLIRKRQVKNRG